jgi:hypothetical protein
LQDRRKAVKLQHLLVIVAASCAVGACDGGRPPSDQVAGATEETGPFEVVRERAGEDGALQLRVRAQRLDAADEIARKLVQQKKRMSQRIAKIEFIGPSDDVRGPSRRVIENPQEHPRQSGT